MKNLLVIAMALVSVSAFAEHHEGKDNKEGHKAAMEACKAHAKDKKAHESCMAEHTKTAPAAEMAAPAPKK